MNLNFWPFKRLSDSPEPRTHNLRLDGVNAGVLDVYEDGARVNVCMFRRGVDWSSGDFVVFERSSGKTTRYKIDRIETPRDPGDQHFLYCTFAPRPAAPSDT